MSGRRAGGDEIEWVIEEFRTRYFDFTAKHFHEAIHGRPMADGKLFVRSYQPVDEVLVQSERRSKRIFTTIRAGMALRATRTMRMASSAALSAVGSRIRAHQPRATASFGVPAPMSRRMSSPRLCPATWIR